MGTEEKIGYYRRALEYDPGYADAYTGMADEWIRLAVQGTVAPREVIGKAHDAIQEALRLDDNSPDAHFNAATLKSAYQWDWPGGDREFLRTLELSPNSTSTRIRYAHYLSLMGRRQDALNQLEQIRILDPVSGEYRGVEAAVYYFLRDYERTIVHARTVLSAQPNIYLLHFWLGRAYESQGRLREAKDALEKWNGIPGTMQGRGFGMLASVYARTGQREDALRLLDAAIARGKRTYVSPCSVALVYIGLRDFDRAIEWLEKGYQERDHSMVTLKADAAYDPLRGDARFVSLLRRMKLE